MNKTHHSAELRESHVGQSVCLVGWVDSLRDHGGVTFVDLRDREGLTQLVFDSSHSDFAGLGQKLKQESVIEVRGTVKARPPATLNPNLPTGGIEVEVSNLVVHNTSAALPFPLDDYLADKVGEELRLTYRYLDLRRPKNLRRLRLRHQVTQAIHRYLDLQGFIEVELPTLFKSTPEGAREFLVPSRLNPGQFYALSQSPQQYKQMLMVAGLERYYSVARCYRDEDLRADRQPEFTQVDLELSFIDREDLYALIEGMLKDLWKKTLGVDIPTPFPRLSYQEAMDRYGSDKPDRRFGYEIQDVSPLFQGTAFKVFASVLATGGVIKALRVPHLADISQGELKTLEDLAKSLGAQGLAFIKVEDNGEWKSPIVKFFSPEEVAQLKAQLQLQPGDLVFFAAHQWEKACTILGRIRLEAAGLLVKREKLTLRKDDYAFLWVVDFPLMIWDEDAGRYVSAHHPFTAPVPEDLEWMDTAPERVRGQHYDIVLNGTELGGGSIRIHQPDVQRKVFEDILKLPPDVVQSRFGYMLKAFTFGAPPHGGIALGLDRLCAMLAGTPSIREVLAFPKTQKGQDLMAGSPGPVTAKQLQEVFITSLPPPEKPSTTCGA